MSYLYFCFYNRIIDNLFWLVVQSTFRNFIYFTDQFYIHSWVLFHKTTNKRNSFQSSGFYFFFFAFSTSTVRAQTRRRRSSLSFFKRRISAWLCIQKPVYSLSSLSHLWMVCCDTQYSSDDWRTDMPSFFTESRIFSFSSGGTRWYLFLAIFFTWLSIYIALFLRVYLCTKYILILV